MPLSTYRIENNAAHNIQHDIKPAEAVVEPEKRTFNRLALKALLLDTITRIKFGNNATLAPNSNQAKQAFLQAIRINKKRMQSKELIFHIAEVYRHNNLLHEYNGTVKKFGLDLYTVNS